jgi:hypothetical protein
MDIETEIAENDADILKIKPEMYDSKEIQNIEKLENYYLLKNVYSENIKTQKTILKL